jgi:hypothetical protein
MATVFTELVLLVMYYLTRFRICDCFDVKILLLVNDPNLLIPFPGFTMEIITAESLNERFVLSLTADSGLDALFGCEGVVHRPLEVPTSRAAPRARDARGVRKMGQVCPAVSTEIPIHRPNED